MKKIILPLSRLLILGAIIVFVGPGCKKDTIPVLTTSPVIYLSGQSVTCDGNVTDEGSASVTERGICWSTMPNPTTAGNKIPFGSGPGAFTCTLPNLDANTQYFVRAYAISKAGTGYGPQVIFRTWNTEIVIDIDGNVYHTVTIGTQVWMVENLRVTHYRSGTAIPWVTDNTTWENLTTGALCSYNNNAGDVSLYGRLYNWFAVNNPEGLAPDGWHVPSDAEWSQLSDYLGGEAVAGGKLKEAGLAHWQDPNTAATNETGFSALPGGHRLYSGLFDYFGAGTGWWGSTEANSNDAVIRYLDFGSADLWNYLEDKRFGRSVRCIKD